MTLGKGRLTGLILGLLGVVVGIISIRDWIRDRFVDYGSWVGDNNPLCHPVVVTLGGVALLTLAGICWGVYRPGKRTVLRALKRKYGFLKTEYSVVTKIRTDGSALGTVTQVIHNLYVPEFAELEYNYFTLDRPDDDKAASIGQITAVPAGKKNIRKSYKVEYRCSAAKPHSITGTIHIHPPLKPGEKLRLSFTRSAPHRTFHLKATTEVRREYSSQVISYPMDLLSMSVEFPDNPYFPGEYGVECFYGKKRVVSNKVEQERLDKLSPCFTRPGAPLVLRMELPYPVVGLQYVLWWRLPTATHSAVQGE